MRIIKDQTNYIERRLAGEEVIPRAYLYGLTAVEKVLSANEVMVVSINTHDFSAYVYEIKDGNFRIRSFQENVHHSLSEVLTNDILDSQTLAWWKAVFFEKDGQCTYDQAYDEFRVSEKDTQTFQEMIQSVKQSFESLNLPAIPSIVCIVGEYSMNPLVRYVLHQKLASHNNVHLIPCEDITTDTFEGSQNRIIHPTEKIQASPIRINGVLLTDLIMQQPIPITFPLLCIDNILVNDIPWSWLVSDRRPDYRAGNLDFKLLYLQADCDVYGSIFLSCVDICRNRSIVKF